MKGKARKKVVKPCPSDITVNLETFRYGTSSTDHAGHGWYLDRAMDIARHRDESHVLKELVDGGVVEIGMIEGNKKLLVAASGREALLDKQAVCDLIKELQELYNCMV